MANGLKIFTSSHVHSSFLNKIPNELVDFLPNSNCSSRSEADLCVTLIWKDGKIIQYLYLFDLRDFKKKTYFDFENFSFQLEKIWNWLPRQLQPRLSRAKSIFYVMCPEGLTFSV